MALFKAYLAIFITLCSFSTIGKETECPATGSMFESGEKLGFYPLYLGMVVTPDLEGFEFDYPPILSEHCGNHSATFKQNNTAISVQLDREYRIISMGIWAREYNCVKDELVQEAKQTFTNIKYSEPMHYSLAEDKNDSPAYTLGNPIKGLLLVKPTWTISIGELQCYD